MKGIGNRLVSGALLPEGKDLRLEGLGFRFDKAGRDVLPAMARETKRLKISHDVVGTILVNMVNRDRAPPPLQMLLDRQATLDTSMMISLQDRFTQAACGIVGRGRVAVRLSKSAPLIPLPGHLVAMLLSAHAGIPGSVCISRRRSGEYLAPLIPSNRKGRWVQLSDLSPGG